MGVRIVHSSQQFSDTKAQHIHDADALFGYCRDNGVSFVSGTEAGNSPANNDLRMALLAASKRTNFLMNAHKWGDWTAVNLSLCEFIEDGYAGPFIEGTTGLKPSQGAHAPRGITWSTARSKAKGVGVLTMGSAHFLTQRSIVASKTTNAPLQLGIGAWGKQKSKGKRLVFIGADVNQDDERRQPFGAAPFTTVWDELGKYPATHGRDKQHGSTIDVIASYDADRRVSAQSARVLDDGDLSLYTDHFVIDATFAVRLMGPAKKS